MKQFFILLITASTFASCTSSIHLQMLKPADVTLPQEIEKFTLVNRTKPAKKNQAWNIIEGVITGEGLFADREGADNCLGGLMQIMQRTPRYTINQTSVEYKGSGVEIFAPPLSWAEVEKLCQQNNSEAIIVLEAFDSDSRITGDSKQVQIKDKEGLPATVTEFYSHAQMEVKTGWRVYYPKEKRIVDEFRFSDFLTFDSKGTTPENATAALPNKRECIKKTGHQAGTTYGFRISPQWITVSRYFYTRGSDNMKVAGKKARQINDWKGAMEIWKKESLNSDKKIAWHANYNMAVACEREGNLDLALEWAKKSYDRGQKSAAAQYVNTLKFRISEQKKADEQMKTK
ncbi:MAG: hypothetical protein EPN85_03460 [Bacteroidetes bacterium]|nr:MAG: hypothetical protein EPN85_03460 [Bacteroidota bacterium]